jgi:hypothetical protein
MTSYRNLYSTLYPYRVATYGGRWLVTAFIAGALAVLVFHQGAFALMNLAGFPHHAMYSMQATRPFGIPAIWSITFWGGVWGLIFAAIFRGLEGVALVIAGIVFGALVLSAFAWLVVAPLKGQGIAAGAVPANMLVAMIVNGAWGFGTGLGLALFGRSTGDRRPVGE